MGTINKLTILIADDHPIFRDGIASALSAVNYNTIEAANGKEVIQILQTKRVDVILLDLKMAPMNGLETMQEIKIIFPKVKVIILSMHEEARYILEVVQAGASGYLFKNASRKEIISAIDDVMLGKKTYSNSLSAETLNQLNQLEIEPSAMHYSHEEKLREIMFLLCHQFTSKQIADFISLSPRTVEDYRSEIMTLTKSKNNTGVIKYAIEAGIYEDLILSNRFKSQLEKSIKR